MASQAVRSRSRSRSRSRPGRVRGGPRRPRSRGQGASAVAPAGLDPEPRDGGPVTSEVIKAETPANPVVVTCDVSRAGDVDNAAARACRLPAMPQIAERYAR